MQKIRDFFQRVDFRKKSKKLILSSFDTNTQQKDFLQKIQLRHFNLDDTLTLCKKILRVVPEKNSDNDIVFLQQLKSVDQENKKKKLCGIRVAVKGCFRKSQSWK